MPFLGYHASAPSHSFSAWVWSPGGSAVLGLPPAGFWVLGGYLDWMPVGAHLPACLPALPGFLPATWRGAACTCWVIILGPFCSIPGMGGLFSPLHSGGLSCTGLGFHLEWGLEFCLKWEMEEDGVPGRAFSGRKGGACIFVPPAPGSLPFFLHSLPGGRMGLG